MRSVQVDVQIRSHFGHGIIGEIYGQHIISVDDDGHIIFIDDGLKMTDSDTKLFTITHSSIRTFVDYINIYLSTMSQYGSEIEKENEQIAEYVVNYLEKEFLKTDPIALSDDDGFWSMRLEEISYIYIS